MRLPSAPPKYHSNDVQLAYAEIERADAENFKKRSDLEVGDARLILKSPNGTRYSVTVDNSGNLSASSL
mgnify:CR=1 FL=1